LFAFARPKSKNYLLTYLKQGVTVILHWFYLRESSFFLSVQLVCSTTVIHLRFLVQTDR